ncbi:TIGR03086 family metal-binding protein [Ruania zhangjianzhongii]|uniref:TIGR03086 family metal-binding protein n=1 Tax=Ruania zhangjianzhongii TaxID=2603206 RepID=UPI0011C903BB|nr:TIGR03086 family metal-binding protein [Ruania zhangjianzhongii]
MAVVDATVDPRPQLARALDQVEHQIAELRPHDFGRSTPCAEYDARTLLAHLVAVLRKLEVVRHGGDMTQVNDPATDLHGDEDAAFRHARTAFERAWEADSALGPDYTLAWGTMPGRALLDAYTHEFTVHAWDLSQVTGRGDDLDPVLAHAALDWFSRNVPAEDRSEDGPFAPVVAIANDAGPYARLAAFVGRQAAL